MGQQGQDIGFYTDMGFRLKQIRQSKHMSQSDLAEALGLVTQTIQKYESGEVKISADILLHCARLFQISVGYFYGEDNVPHKYSRASLMIASQIMALPSPDIQRNLYLLVQSIVKTTQQDNKNSKQE